jgi:hypothetical protein
MTMQFPVPDPARINDSLFNGPTDWVSPGSGAGPGDGPKPGGDRLSDPPPNDGRKVVISDTDHYSPFQADALWAWKSFLRGHNPILYDLGIVAGAKPSDPTNSAPGTPPYLALEPARYALGDTLRTALKVRLAAMTPRGDVCSTGYGLANPGQEYLILQPAEHGGSFTVALEVGTYAAEWHNLATRETQRADDLTVERQPRTSFTPTVGPAVLHLTRVAD